MKVKSHKKISKKGKLFEVKDYDKNNPFIRKIVVSAIKFVNSKNSLNEKDLNSYLKKIKIEIIKDELRKDKKQDKALLSKKVIKKLNFLEPKIENIFQLRKNRIKKENNNYKNLKEATKVESEHKDLYEELSNRLKKEKIEMPMSKDEFFRYIAKEHLEENEDYYDLLKKYVENKSEKQKSKFKFYFSGGNIDGIITNENKFSVGDTFYNQQIENDNNWKETINRKGLMFLQVKDIYSVNGKESLVIESYNIKNGKVNKIKEEFFTKKSFYNYLREGK